MAPPAWERGGKTPDIFRGVFCDVTKDIFYIASMNKSEIQKLFYCCAQV